MNGLIKNLISPKIGLALIKKEIERQTDVTVKDFHIIYHSNYDNLKFNVIPETGQKFAARFPDENGTVTETIKTMIYNQLDEHIEIDGFIVSYEKGQINCKVFYQVIHPPKRKNGKPTIEKIKQVIEL